MCSYLDQVGSTYYFRRSVPKGLAGAFFTNSGQPRTEWKFSLKTKGRETAKRLLRPHEIDTDALIDNARTDAKSLHQSLPIAVQNDSCPATPATFATRGLPRRSVSQLSRLSQP